MNRAFGALMDGIQLSVMESIEGKKLIIYANDFRSKILLSKGIKALKLQAYRRRVEKYIKGKQLGNATLSRRMFLGTSFALGAGAFFYINKSSLETKIYANEIHEQSFNK